MVILVRSVDGKTVRRQAQVSIVEIEMALHLFVDVTDEYPLFRGRDVPSSIGRDSRREGALYGRERDARRSSSFNRDEMKRSERHSAGGRRPYYNVNVLIL